MDSVVEFPRIFNNGYGMSREPASIIEFQKWTSPPGHRHGVKWNGLRKKITTSTANSLAAISLPATSTSSSAIARPKSTQCADISEWAELRPFTVVQVFY
ncbi:hypothetical protein EI94DRAFT_1755615 [Lactarius quietus]|nr:hypothetical protein EI94DRAFT_1755615 [Lactarius quietus]